MVLKAMALWRRVCDRTGVSAAFSHEWWERVLERYSEPQRHYHNMSHIEELSALHATVDGLGLFHRPDTVAWTVFFHDIVYEPTRNDNEDQSADVWLDFASDLATDVGHRDEQMIATVRQYILQTKNHTTCPLDAEKDLRLFLDMDLAILGAPKERYTEYAEQIAREYSHYPRDAYCAGRAKVLRTFAVDAHLFKTEELSERLLKNARENLAWEITQLESPPMVLEPVFFADRAGVLQFENECRGRDPLRIAPDDLDHMLAMNTGKLSIAFRHRDTKELIAMVVASMSPLDDASERAYAEAFPSEASSPLTDDAKSARLSDVAVTMAKASAYDPAVRSEVDVHGSHLMIHSLCVSKSLRRRGLATKLLKDYLSLIRKEYPQIKRVTAVVPEFMARCLGRLGFVNCGARKAYDYDPSVVGGAASMRRSPIGADPTPPPVTAGSPTAAGLKIETSADPKAPSSDGRSPTMSPPGGALRSPGSVASPTSLVLASLMEMTMVIPPESS